MVFTTLPFKVAPNLELEPRGAYCLYDEADDEKASKMPMSTSAGAA